MAASLQIQRGTLAGYGRATLIVLLAGWAFIFTLRTSLAGILRAEAPQSALNAYSADAEAKAGVAAQLVTAQITKEKPSAADLDRARAMSLDALRDSPLSVTAMRTLAMISDVRGDRATAWKLLNQAQAISRRDLLTQLSIIEYLSAAGDVDGTLHHYDIAMRASRVSREVLIPILIEASADPQLVQPIAKLVATRPPQWWTDYMIGLVGGGSVPNAVAISNAVLKAENPVDRPLILAMIVRTIEAKRYDLAWSVYSHAFPAEAKATQDGLRDGGFEGGHDVVPFDWQLSSEVDFFAERGVGADGQGQQLVLTALSGRMGEIAKQLLRLSPGRHRLTFQLGNVPQSPLDRPSVAIRCAEPEGQILFDRKPDRAGSGPVQLGGDFVVPAGCQSQWILIRASGQGAVTDAKPWVDNLRIERGP